MMKDTTIRIVNLNNQQLLLNIIEHDKKVNSRGEEQCDSYSKINFDKGKIDLEAHNLSQLLSILLNTNTDRIINNYPQLDHYYELHYVNKAENVTNYNDIIDPFIKSKGISIRTMDSSVVIGKVIINNSKQLEQYSIENNDDPMIFNAHNGTWTFTNVTLSAFCNILSDKLSYQLKYSGEQKSRRYTFQLPIFSSLADLSKELNAIGLNTSHDTVLTTFYHISSHAPHDSTQSMFP